ncbi:MAG: mechanosensitive ion channel family protein [Thermoanaerobaculia bacterium]
MPKPRPTENARLLALLVEERGDASATNLLSTLQMLESLEVDTSEPAAGADELTAQVAPPAADAEAEAPDQWLRRWLLEARDALHTRLPLFLKRLAVALGIFALFWVLARFARRLTSGVLQRTRLSSSTILRDMIVRTTGRLILFAGVLIVLWQFGFGSAPVLAGVGIAGVAISFALQDILANFAAGGMILAYRPYDVGDVVEAAGVTGKVQNMNVVSTRILTFDHQTLIVPNGKIWGDVIRNVTVEPIRRVDLEFGIAYEDDVTRAERLFAEIVAGHEKVLDDPAPVIKLHRLGESSVDFIVRPWAKTEDYWDVYWDVTREVKMRFDQDGLSFPYPQRDVHLIGAPAAEESAGPDEGAGDSEPS